MAISNILKLFGGSSRSDNSASSGNCAKNVSGSQTKKISDDQEASGVVINGIRWATCNVAAPGVFADKPEDAGMFYQWNRKKAWSATGKVTGWDNSMPRGHGWKKGDDFNGSLSGEWKKANDPSPAGWRLPEAEEFDKLFDERKVKSEWTTVNKVYGRKFTDKATGNSIFLPAAGIRRGPSGICKDAGSNGYYWSKWNWIFQPFGSVIGRENETQHYDYYYCGAVGCSCRCVADL